MNTKQFPNRVPNVTFKTRIPSTLDEATASTVCDDSPFSWKDKTTDDIFLGKKVILFALPGAFTPTCSATHVPGYDKFYDNFKMSGVDEVICLAVNDAFVMEQWGKKIGVNKITFLPDGNGDFTRAMGMNVKKENIGFGERSWRYSMYVVDGEIKIIFPEPNMMDNSIEDPFGESSAEKMLEYLQS